MVLFLKIEVLLWCASVLLGEGSPLFWMMAFVASSGSNSPFFLVCVTMKTKALCFFRMLGTICPVAWCHFIEDLNLQSLLIFNPWHDNKMKYSNFNGGTTVAQWLMCCATNRKVAGSISAGVSEFFIDIKNYRSHYGRGVFPGGKGGRCVRQTTYHHPVPLSWNLGTLPSWNPLGLCRPVMGLIYLLLPLL